MCAKTLNPKSRMPASATAGPANRNGLDRMATKKRLSYLNPATLQGSVEELSFLSSLSMATRSPSEPGLDKSKTRSNLSQLVTVDRIVEKKKSEPALVSLSGDEHVMDAQEQSTPVYKLYRRRWLGLISMVVLNVVAAMNWIWFSAIATSTAGAFDISLSQVNWLGQVVNLIYLPMALSIPSLIKIFGIRNTCFGAAVSLLLASWMRYAGASKALSSEGSYAFLIVGQIFAGFAQPVFQVLGPKFSETWFDLKSRTTATMIIAVSNPIGSALGQLIPPFISTPRASLLVLAVTTTAAIGTVAFIQEAPPTPPTYAGSRPSPPIMDTISAFLGRHQSSDPEAPSFTKTERIDFLILVMGFGTVVGAISGFSILTNQILAPVGYSEETAGFVGAALLLMGLLAGIITSPLFDRVLTHHLARSLHILLPPLAACWIGLIFAIQPNNPVPIYVVAGLIGVLGFILLPVSLELGCEVTRNAEVSSSIMWMSGNLWTLVFVLAADSLRDRAEPHGLRKELILIATVVSVATSFIFFLKGHQTRRQIDMEKSREANNIISL